MAERDDLLASIAKTTADYRGSDGVSQTPERVGRWINQFDAAVQLPVLREMDHVLKETYFSKKRIVKFLSGLFKTQDLVGDDPCAFWKDVKFLDIQGAGASQKEMLALFGAVLENKCGFNIDSCGLNPDAFVYLDDAIFSGGRVGHDLSAWVTNEAPNNAALHVIVIASHQGSYYHKGLVDEAITASGKNVTLKWWSAVELENRKKYTDTSDVLSPVSIPSDLPTQAYVDSLKYSPKLRNAGQVGSLGIFSSDQGRQLLEQEFLKAGVRIRAMCPNLNQYQRPLGNMVLDTLGFGSLIVTFRNCPNNAPLALWAGDPWYPLFPRTTNSATSLRNFLEMVEEEYF